MRAAERGCEDDAILRYNSCLCIIQKHRLRAETRESEQPLE